MSAFVPAEGGSLVRAQLFARRTDGSDRPLGEAERETATAALLASVRRAGRQIDALVQEDERFVGLSVEFEDIETVAQRAQRILTDAGIAARLHHTGGGIWVAEARSEAITDRIVWVIDSEGEPAGPFLVVVYPREFAEREIESLSGACDEEELIQRVSRGLSTEIGDI